MLKVYFPRLSSNRVENVKKLVTVNLRLEGTVDGQAEVLGLDGLAATGTELDVLLAEGCILSLEEGNLGQDLVGERAGHDEGRVAGSTAKVDKTALGEEDDVLAVEAVTVNLGLDVLDGLGVGLQPGDVNLDIEVTDV
jgi:hypothetical protein